ncbi:MAG: helix-turn-helix domain-containing protein [Alphaproteobacteria bacterium]|nr:helix-turn-helix domain-containing protein [Alphaproteobacteria bacterium]MCB9699534.1 helix-turn-helix domain-containing protein [Alphaproteobacteria bacterium]
MDEGVVCHLEARRKLAGLTLTELAARVGVSRQALSAIAAGRATPSTAVALRLARELRCAVEELFALPPPALGGLRVPEQAGARVVVGKVGERWVTHTLPACDPTPADALVDADGVVSPLVDPGVLGSAALVAGCAPVLGLLAARTGRADARATWLEAPSGAALRWLAEGRVHVAGMHLAPADLPEAHDQALRRAMPGEDLRVVTLVGWRQGLISREPLEIADLPGRRVARRPAGAGATLVLGEALRGIGAHTELAGPSVATHLDAARAVLLGAADAAVVIEPVARAFGLAFLPLSEERFELALRAGELRHPAVARLLDALADASYAREVAGMGPYDLGRTGGIREVAA